MKAVAVRAATRARRAYRIGLALAVGVVSTRRAITAQAAPETPPQVTDRFVTALRTADYPAMTALMHPMALHQLRDLFGPILELPQAGEYRDRLLGVATVAEVRALSDTAFFTAFLRATSERDADLLDALAGATVHIIGWVPEGPDTAHVVYRMGMTVRGAAVSQMDVMSLGRLGNAWRGLLKGDFSAMAAALRDAVGAGGVR
jgi:hypothetical protein